MNLRPKLFLSILLVAGALASAEPALASYAQMNLCRKFWNCLALVSIFFAVFGVPVAVAIAVFVHRRAHPQAPVGRSVAISLGVGAVAYLVAITVVTLLGFYLPWPKGGTGLGLGAAAFLAVVLALAVPACRRWH